MKIIKQIAIFLKENFSEYDDVDIEKSFIEELYFYYDVFTKRHWKQKIGVGIKSCSFF